MTPAPEAWLRGPLPGIPVQLQPLAFALVGALEDVEKSVAGLDPVKLWHEPGGAASVGFHLLHLAGSTDRLLTYARGEPLGDGQRAALADEKSLPDPRPTLEALVAGWREVVARALAQFGATPEATLDDSRGVGRAQLPSTVRGLLTHAAEHAQRHVGQIVTTAKIVGALGAAALGFDIRQG